MKRIAVLCSGGDSPGMNAAVAAIARSAGLYNMPLIGIIRGYNGVICKDSAMLDAFFDNARRVVKGSKHDENLLSQVETAVREEPEGTLPDIRPLLEKYREEFALADTMDGFLERFPAYRSHMQELDRETILDINNQPGTYLRTARCDDFRRAAVRLRAVINLIAIGVEGLVVIGGDGSFQGATLLCQMGMPCIGIPGTIDNDLTYTEMTLGYDTAVNVCMHAVLQIRSTSRAHDRPHVVEVMGRQSGDIALRTAMSTGAEILLVREVKWSVDDVIRRMQTLIDDGNTRATVVIAEGAYDSMEPFSLYSFLGPIYEKKNLKLPPDKQLRLWHEEPMSADRLAEVIKYKCHDAQGMPVEARATVLGYTQRGEMPSAYDAMLGHQAGNMAVRLLMDNRQDMVIGIKEGRVYSLPISDMFKMQGLRDDYFDYAMYNLVNRQ
ncbi:ATP-dependent 6-phosphofructokinase [Eubacteriales bacterium OttesenSCG-928-A19]|nr:ATP-dependent 6-phosphofructokinase [Eubacteriales bacterium OttesenSCG-928-A19]